MSYQSCLYDLLTSLMAMHTYMIQQACYLHDVEHNTQYTLILALKHFLAKYPLKFFCITTAASFNVLNHKTTMAIYTVYSIKREIA